MITPVATPIAVDSARHDAAAKSILSFVAKADVRTLTRLFPIKIVIRSLSVLFLRYLSVLAPNLRFLTSVSMVWSGIDMNAISLPEKNADNQNNTINIMIDVGSIE